MASPHDPAREGIRLDDGTWVDVGADGKWRPSPGERARAAVILAAAIGVLLVLAMVFSVGGGDDDETGVAAQDTTTSTEAPTTSAPTTTATPEPSSIGGEPASARCQSDDRGAAPLRPREESAVLVLNGTSRTGHAGDVTGELAAAGYETGVPGNAGREDVTTIAYLPGFCAEAERAATDLRLPDAVVQPMPEEAPVALGQARLLVTLGADSLER